LAEHAGILMELTIKDTEKKLPPWTDHYQLAFDSIKSIVTSRKCLTTIDLSKLPEYKIFVTTDASDKHWVLSCLSVSIGKVHGQLHLIP